MQPRAEPDPKIYGFNRKVQTGKTLLSKVPEGISNVPSFQSPETLVWTTGPLPRSCPSTAGARFIVPLLAPGRPGDTEFLYHRLIMHSPHMSGAEVISLICFFYF